MSASKQNFLQAHWDWLVAVVGVLALVAAVGLYALRFQKRSGLDGQANGVAVGDDGHILAFPQLVGLADGKLRILIIDDRDSVAGKAQVHRAVKFGGGADHLAHEVAHKSDSRLRHECVRLATQKDR